MEKRKNWKSMCIGDLCDTISETYRGNDDAVILINTSDVLEGIVLNHEAVPNKNLKGQFKKTFKKDDILFSEIRPANRRYAFVDFEDTARYIASTKLMVLRPRTDIILPRYLYAILSSADVLAELQLLAETRSGTFPQITFGSELAPYPVLLPDLFEQEMIVSILECLNQKIALNTRINDNLQQMAQTVFSLFFIDYEPFDEPFAVSPIGTSIPESLHMVQIGDLKPVLETGKRPKGGATASGVPSIGAENVKKLGEVNFSSNKYIPTEFASSLKTGKVKGYELMLYKDGGKPGTFTPHFSMFGEGFPYADFYINEHVFKLDFGDRGFNEFAYFYFQTEYPYNWLANNGGKAAIPGINRQDINSIWIFSPEHPIVRQFCEWVQPLFTTIFSNCLQNVRLANLRDTLLPRLMSGEPDVSGLEL